MTIKKSNQILAQGLYSPFLLDTSIPKGLLEEMDRFINRNSIIKEPLSGEKICCMRCLKAHIIKKSQEMNIKPTPIRLGKISKEEIGHSGYYLDGEDIIACMN